MSGSPRDTWSRDRVLAAANRRAFHRLFGEPWEAGDPTRHAEAIRAVTLDDLLEVTTDMARAIPTDDQLRAENRRYRDEYRNLYHRYIHLWDQIHEAILETAQPGRPLSPSELAHEWCPSDAR